MSQAKTEEPTPKRVREARRRGEVAQSRELASGVGLLAFAGAVAWLGEGAIARVTACARSSWGALDLSASPTAAFAACAGQGAEALLPVLLLAAGGAGFASFLQVGPLLAPRALVPETARLDPVKGAGRLFGRRAWVQLGKALLVLAFLAAALLGPLRESLGGLANLSSRGAAATGAALTTLVPRLVARAGGVLVAVGLLDLLFQRWRLRRDLRMSREEVRREHREAEGEPHAKQERQRLHREIVEHRLLEEVRRADVLVVNPTHLAIALRYDAEAAEQEHDPVPEVTAKGQDGLARRMMDAAREAGVPILRDVPLARSLFELEVGDAIPEVLYEAVAAVLHAAWDERSRVEGEPEGS